MQWWCAAVGTPWSWEWRPYPGVWLFILGVALLFPALRRIARRTAPGDELAARGRPVVYALGTVALWLTLDWPVGALGGGYLASVHMVQFLMIAYVVAPLLLLGTPRGAFERLTQKRIARAILTPLTHPLVTLVVFNALVAVTHLPGPTDFLMASQLGSFALDMLWLAGGLVFWWPVCAPVFTRAWMLPPAHVIYVWVQIIAGTPLFAALAFADLPIYATYELAPRVHDITARADQQAAGLLMKTMGMPIMLVATAIIFLSWAKRSEREDRGGAPAGSDQAAPATQG